MKRPDLWRYLDALIGPTVVRRGLRDVASDVGHLATVLSERASGAFSPEEIDYLRQLRETLEPISCGRQSAEEWFRAQSGDALESFGILISRLHEMLRTRNR